jgi:predicted RNase H-like HicB family nuclease
MTAVFTCHSRPDGKFVAHSLDFDLVSVAGTEEEAFRKLRIAVKTYVEHGLSNNWADDIHFPAPTEYWDKFQYSKSMTTMDPIRVEDNRMMVVRAIMNCDEHQLAACQA